MCCSFNSSCGDLVRARWRNALTRALQRLANLRRRAIGSDRARGALFVVLMLGIFSIPVTCAQASGPHSMFVPADTTHVSLPADPHAHHRTQLLHIDIEQLEQVQEWIGTVDAPAQIAAWKYLADPVQQTGVNEMPDTHPFVVATVALDHAGHYVAPVSAGADLPFLHTSRLTGLSEEPVPPPPRTA